MKFHNGCWLLKEGYGSFSPRQVYDCRKGENEVVISAPTSVVSGRANTIDGINLTIRISSPMPEVLREQTWHHMGTRRKNPQFELELTQEQKLTVEESGNHIIVRNGQACY